MIRARHTQLACTKQRRLPVPWTACWDGVHRLGQPLRMENLTCDSRRNSIEPGMPRGGWQHEAGSRVELEQRFRDADLFPSLNAPGEAVVRSQAGPGAGLALCPTCRLTSLEPQLFRVLLLRRLHLHLPMSARFCRCGQPLDPCGHGHSLESIAARICREAGARDHKRSRP